MNSGPLLPSFAARMEACPAGPKLLALVLAGTGLLLAQAPWLLGVAAILVAGLALAILGPARLAGAWTAGLVLAIGVLVLFTLVVDGASAALAALCRLAALVCLAQIVTGTTRASAMQDALVAALRPFERLPFVSAEKAGLALALALRSLPRVGAAMADLREARQARGLAVSPLRLVIPLVARILHDARETADAIDARSWSGDRKPPR